MVLAAPTSSTFGNRQAALWRSERWTLRQDAIKGPVLLSVDGAKYIDEQGVEGIRELTPFVMIRPRIKSSYRRLVLRLHRLADFIVILVSPRSRVSSPTRYG